MTPDHIQILSENPIEQVWLHLSRLESVPLARRAIEARIPKGASIDASRLDSKARGVAYSLRSARDYLRDPPDSITKRVLSTYYSLMAALSAILIAGPMSSYDLIELEQASKFGHGLGNVDDPLATFPSAQKVYITSNGFFHRYLKYIGIDANLLKIETRVDGYGALNADERNRCVSLDALLARVPELTSFYFEITGRPPLAAQVFSAEGRAAGVVHMRFLPDNASVHVWDVGIQGPGFEAATPDQVAAHLQIPIADLRTRTDLKGRDMLLGTIDLPAEAADWSDVLRPYRSPMCPTSWFRPVFGTIDDPLALHFLVLYVLGIIVRYRPSLWREVTEGDLTEYFALVRSYLSVVDRVVPELVLARVTGRQVTSVSAGGLGALT